MCDRKEVTGEMQMAAQEIERVYLGLTRGVLIRQPNLHRVDGAGRPDLPAAILDAYRYRYKPWANTLSARKKRQGIPALECVIDVVIDGHTLADCDYGRQWQNGFTKYVVLRSLLEYAVMARWIGAGELEGLDRRFGEFARRARLKCRRRPNTRST